MPELPDAKKARFHRSLGLSAYDAGVLVAEKELRMTLRKLQIGGGAAVANNNDAKLAANWVTTELAGALNKVGKELTDSPCLSAEQLGGLEVKLISDNTISGKIAKDVFAEMFYDQQERHRHRRGQKGSPSQVTDTGAIEKIVNEVLAENSGQDRRVQIRQGQDVRLLRLARSSKNSGGKANPGELVNDLAKSETVFLIVISNASEGS